MRNLYVLTGMLLTVFALFLYSCKPATEAAQKKSHSTDRTFPAIPESSEEVKKKDSLLQLARANLKKDSSTLEHWIWYGRRMAYTFDYETAIDIYSRALEIFSDSPELYRHRGHRYISIRKLDQAIGDLERAAILAKDLPMVEEPDGIPNKLNIPLSNLHFNIWYHLGLAYYLKADFRKAVESYKECLSYSINADLLVATTDWLYMSLRRMQDTLAANQCLSLIHDELEIIENESYYKRLKMYQGKLSAGDLLDLENTSAEAQLEIVTQGYGVANWHLYEGDTLQSVQLFKKIVNCAYWPAFGFIAAEADLSRLDN